MLAHKTLLVVGLALCFWASPRLDAANRCDPMDGLQLLAQADAREDGYLLSTRSGQSLYFRHAVYDLVLGRIRYFETAQPDGRFARYHLASAHNSTCIERRLFDRELSGLPMPAGRCVAKIIVTEPGSRFAVGGYPEEMDRIPAQVTIRDRHSGRLLAEYRRPRFAWLRGKSACLRQARKTPGHPIWNLSSFVFADHWDATIQPADLERVQYEEAPGAGEAELLPPRAWAVTQLAEAGTELQPACHLPGWMGETVVHVIEVDRAPLAVQARLDAKHEQAGIVILDVHAPDKAVVILARARGPTVWHLHESSRSSVVAVLVRGEHGQAVVGLTRHSHILMSTGLHNPFTNCTAQELREIEERVTQQYGVTRMQRQVPGASPTVLRYSIGEPMPDGAELFYLDYPLEAFELRDD